MGTMWEYDVRDHIGTRRFRLYGREGEDSVGPVACERRPPMKRNELRRDTAEPHTTDQNCASFATEEGLVIYDPEDPDAWLESDAVIAAEEVA